MRDGAGGYSERCKAFLRALLQESHVNEEICREFTYLHNDIEEKMRVFLKTDYGTSDFLSQDKFLRNALNKYEVMWKALEVFVSFDIDTDKFDETLKGLNMVCNSQWTKANVFMKGNNEFTVR